MKSEKPSIRLHATPHEVAAEEGEDRATLVIDVFRAGTTIATALHAGARSVIPVVSVEEALRLGATLDRDSTLLCGERESLRIDGFDFGNSPSEIAQANIAGKSLVLVTTNGAKALAGATSRSLVVAASFVTLEASARRVASEPTISIICAGSAGNFSFEDFLCGGFLVREIQRASSLEYELEDGARAALELAHAHRTDAAAALRASDHARRLEALGFQEDLQRCLEFDAFPFVPVLRDGCLFAEAPWVTAPPR